jgi:drug/metabolite transporter (DMT)-like permease
MADRPAQPPVPNEARQPDSGVIEPRSGRARGAPYDGTMLDRPASATSAQVYAVVGLGVAAVSMAAPLIKVAAAPPLSIAAYRLVLAGIPALALALLTRRSELRGLGSADRRMLLLAGLCLAGHFATWVSSIKYVSVASSTALVTTSPLFVAAFALLFRGERTTRRMAVAIAACTCGGLIIGSADLAAGPRQLLGDGLALAGAGFAAGFLVIGRSVRARISLIAYGGIVYAIAALVSAVVALAARQPVTGFSPRTYGALLLLAAVPQLLGHSSLNWALRHISAHSVAVAVLGEPVLATLAAAIFLGERPGPTRLFGCLLIIFGVFVGLQQEQLSQEGLGTGPFNG